MEETAEWRGAAGGEEGEGARAENCRSRDRAVSFLVIRKQNQSGHDVERWKVLSQQLISLGWKKPQLLLA